MKRTKMMAVAIVMLFLVFVVTDNAGATEHLPIEIPEVVSCARLISPITDVIPAIDGEFEAGEWDDANSVIATAMSNKSQDYGKVYVKNTLETLYILMDYYAPHAEGIDNSLITEILFDVNNDGIFARGYEDDYIRANVDQGAVYTYSTLSPLKEGIANNPSPNNPNPHWIFEWAIPIERCEELDREADIGVHFVFNNRLGKIGEWANPTEDFDYGYPDRWADLHLTDVQLSVSIEYYPLDTMSVTVDIVNPTSEAVTFEWYIGAPQLYVWVPCARETIPAGFNKSSTIPIPFGDWGPTPFGIVHYVQLLDPVSGDVLAQDVALCIYYTECYGSSKPVSPGEAKKITKKITETIEKVEFIT